MGPQYASFILCFARSTVNEKYQEGSPEDEALRIAATALFKVSGAFQSDRATACDFFGVPCRKF
jgi:hypothetical protein